MLNNISKKFHAWTTGWRVIILFIATMLLMFYVMPLAAGIIAFAANDSVLPLEMMVYYSPAEALRTIEKYGEAGRSIYSKVELTADIIYPIIYTLFLGLAISWGFQRAFRLDSKMQSLNVMPIGAWFFDLLENLSIVSMLSMYPSTSPVLAWFSLVFGLLKWAFVLTSAGLAIFGLTKVARNRIRKQSTDHASA